MAVQRYLYSNTQSLVTTILGAILLYAAVRCVYLLYFHPLSKFPGPRIAAVSNTWYAYHWISGRYPWAIESALKKYGDVVRIAPNEVVFCTPKAFRDIYLPHKKSLEVFVKTDFQNRGKNLGGIVWEEDPIRHRAVARKMAPAFSHRSLMRMMPVVERYVDFFVEKMKEMNGHPEGVSLAQWMHWLTMDTSADLATNQKMNQMSNMRNSLDLDVLLAFNHFATVIQVFKRFPLLLPLQYLFVPFTMVVPFLRMEGHYREVVRQRIAKRGDTEHVDFFDFILPEESQSPKSKDENTHLGSVSLQMMFAGFGSVSDWYYSVLFLLVEEPFSYRCVVDEIRNAFGAYGDITSGALTELPWLYACLQEALRCFPSLNTGLPRLSPGAEVDGCFVPRGTHIQTSIWAQSRSPRYFYEPFYYRPKRWLPLTHPAYDPKFANDDLSSVFAFSLGPRGCVGKEMAWMEGRLFLAKVLWMFDVVKVPGQDVNLERDLLHYGFFKKPEVRVRFVEVSR